MFRNDGLNVDLRVGRDKRAAYGVYCKYINAKYVLTFLVTGWFYTAKKL